MSYYNIDETTSDSTLCLQKTTKKNKKQNPQNITKPNKPKNTPPPSCGMLNQGKPYYYNIQSIISRQKLTR